MGLIYIYIIALAIASGYQFLDELNSLRYRWGYFRSEFQSVWSQSNIYNDESWNRMQRDCDKLAYNWSLLYSPFHSIINKRPHRRHQSDTHLGNWRNLKKMAAAWFGYGGFVTVSIHCQIKSKGEPLLQFPMNLPSLISFRIPSQNKSTWPWHWHALSKFFAIYWNHCLPGAGTSGSFTA